MGTRDVVAGRPATGTGWDGVAPSAVPVAAGSVLGLLVPDPDELPPPLVEGAEIVKVTVADPCAYVAVAAAVAVTTHDPAVEKDSAPDEVSAIVQFDVPPVTA